MVLSRATEAEEKPAIVEEKRAPVAERRSPMDGRIFAVVTLMSAPDGDRDSMSDLEGLARRSWPMAVLMTVFMLSLAGFPPFVGFFGKLFLFTAGVSTGWTWLVVIAVLTSVVSVAYYLRVVLHVYTPVGAERAVISLAASPSESYITRERAAEILAGGQGA